MERNMNFENSSKSSRFCPRPFTFCSVHADGTAWVCCHDWLSTSIGSLGDQSFGEVWNSKMAQEVRASILDGSYRYCNPLTCPSLVQDTLSTTDKIHDPYYRNLIDNQTVVMETGPRIVSFSYDNSCNLKCPSCRKELISLHGAEFEKAKSLQAKIIREGLNDAEEVIITGYGDPFASTLYREFLQSVHDEDFPGISIHLMTNGLLLTKEMWDRMSGVHRVIKSVAVSVDAATEETYLRNRGGNFSKLLRNLNFISALLVTGRLSWFEISFVVQANNFREMRQFVDLGRQLCCSRVLFQKIIQWEDTYTDEEFTRVAIHEEVHPQHREFLSVLSDSIFGASMVDLSNLEYLRNSLPNRV
jgi:sulfatase maturation enzyme AslB (radical SAM superfamily)